MTAPTLIRGTTIDRYAVLEVLGGGGMGVVYAAYDPKLDRKVALKLAHEGITTEARARLVREAQALARLSHPNVVAVHDVGEAGGQIFVAMEFVRGRTLAEWLAEQPRPWRAIVAAFLEAGKGLWAAHKVGTVHRDFKADNVLVGDDGRLRVADFGLAAGSTTSSTSEGLSISAPSTDLPVWRTEVGAVLGTPAYMAPEQWRGHSADARTDQFSFCASLYEALYGQLPFEGASAHAIAKNVIAGRVRDPPKKTSVPAWIHPVLLRGLRTKPDDRYASLADLLTALGRDPSVPLRRAGLAVAALALVAVMGLLIQSERRQAHLACAGAERDLAGIWDESERQLLAAAFRRSGKPYAETALRRVEEVLDEYARGWVTMSVAACEATRVRGEQSQALLDLRMQCLGDRRAALGALAEVLATSERAIEGAVPAAMRLPSLEVCAAGQELRARPPVPNGAGPLVTTLRKALATATALDEAGQYADASERAQRIARDAKAAGYAPLEAEALYVLGDARDGLGEEQAAEAVLVSAAAVAEVARSDDVRARALSLLVYVTGYARGDTRRGRQWEALATPVLARAGESTTLRADLLNRVGLLARSDGDCNVALKLYGQALDIYVARHGQLDLREDAIVGNIADCHIDAGDYDEAFAELERALAIELAALGPAHPNSASTLWSMGKVRRLQSRYDEALVLLRRAAGIDEAALGPDHPTIAGLLLEIGQTLEKQGHAGEAIQSLERSVSICRAHPEDMVALARAEFALAEAIRAFGHEPDRADSLGREARAALVKAGARGEKALSEVDAWLALAQPHNTAPRSTTVPVTPARAPAPLPSAPAP